MPVYPFTCTECGRDEEVIRKVDARDDFLECIACHGRMDRGMTLPTVHTINTHLRGTNLGDGMGYVDTNLTDRRTGRAPYITDLSQKRKLLKERGLFEYGNDLPAAKQRDEAERLSKRVSISGSSK